MHKNNTKTLLVYICLCLLIFTYTNTVIAQPGTDTENIGISEVTLDSIDPVITENGKISLSIDGLGTLDSTGIIQVEKPDGATVRSAYMAAASTGFTSRQLANGDIKIDGTDVNWTMTESSSISSFNHWADVTAIVKPKLDAAPAGRVDFVITELDSFYIDGEILAVIFDDPNQASDNTIVLLFGAQDIFGDTFAIGLAEAIDKSDPDLALDLSLGISYGAQGCTGGVQYSQIDVNGARLTTSAGGEDEGGICVNGALLTVGGLDDSNANPADPFATPDPGPRTDDELYNLVPLVNDGDSNISVYTINPSNDDNIFFGALFLTTTAVVGEGIVLSPVSATNVINTQHTVTAKLQDDLGNPIAGRDVSFTVISGPNAGLTGVATTDANGEATFTYTGSTEGTDVIQASFVNSEGVTLTSYEATKIWEDTTPCQPSGPVELCVALDGSGSISSSDFTLQLEGLSLAIENPSVVPQDGRAAISVVQFSDGATLEVSSTAIDSQAAADSVAASVRSISQQRGLTNFSAAINACMGAFVDPQKTWIIDFSTDGEWNIGGDPYLTRDSAVGSGLDILNALGIGLGVDQTSLEQLVWPQPVSPPYAPGFVVLVNDFNEYVTAIREKIREEIITENCNNGQDDDCDGFVDKEDEDCWICGDGIKDPNEECDDGNRISGDGCSDTCKSDKPPVVSIDIEPFSCPSPIDLSCTGYTEVAVLGTETFDVTTIDPATIRLSRAGFTDEAIAPRFFYEDQSKPFFGGPCECYPCDNGEWSKFYADGYIPSTSGSGDADGGCDFVDGYKDLIVKFRSQDLVNMFNLKIEIGQTIPFTLTGKLLDGTDLSGSDCALIIDSTMKGCSADYNCDGDVDGSDACDFKAEYGRRNCCVENLCIGDFDADGDVDGSNAHTFKASFGTRIP